MESGQTEDGYHLQADFRRVLTSYNADSSQAIFGGDDHVMRTLVETKKQRMLIMSSLQTTKKAGKVGIKSGKNRGKKPAARRTKAKDKDTGAKQKAGANPKAKAVSVDNKDKEVSSTKGKDKDEPCKFISK